jgi:hypothetical protein
MVPSRFTLSLVALSVVMVAADARAGSTTLYKTVDANGVVQYSDRPSPGAQKVSVNAQPSGSPGASSTSPYQTDSPAARNPSTAAAPGAPLHPSCEIAEPKPEQVYFDTQTVTVRMRLDPPALAGLTTVLTFDGTEIEGDGRSFVLNPVYRGEHSVLAVVHDATGAVACQTSSVTFYVRDASLLQPAHSAAEPVAPAAPAAPVAPGISHH